MTDFLLYCTVFFPSIIIIEKYAFLVIKLEEQIMMQIYSLMYSFAVILYIMGFLILRENFPYGINI